MLKTLAAGWAVVVLAVGPAQASAADEFGERLRHRLEVATGSDRPMAGPRALRAALPAQAFYAGRRWAPAWLDGPEESVQARLARLLEAVESAADHGLDPADYHRDGLARDLAWLARVPPAERGVRRRVDLELTATDAFLTLAGHFAHGRVDPLAIDPGWRERGRPAEALEELRRVFSADPADPASVLKSLLPPQPEYRLLVEQLARMRGIAEMAKRAESGRWPPVPAGPLLRPGDEDARLAVIRDRLAALGDLPAAGTGHERRYDGRLETGVRAFQARHGLEIDGIVGPATLAALNAPPAARIEQLRANLERWRWLPADLGAEHIRVNIPGFYMEVIQDGRPVMRQRVVVGRPFRRTPVFSGQMTYLVLNPSWEVPPRIATDDLLPRIQAEPDYLARMGFEVLSGWGEDERALDPAEIDWRSLSRQHFPYRLRQAPGPENSLGRVKFMFPNEHNVYLHDSPARELFAHAARAFSAGCIRIGDAAGLAKWLLAGPDRPEVMPAEEIRRVLEGGRETTVALDRPVPVHLLYLTAWVSADGRVRFRDDIYGRDAALIEVLTKTLGRPEAAYSPETLRISRSPPSLASPSSTFQTRSRPAHSCGSSGW